MTEEKAFQQRDFTPDTQTCITGYNVLGNCFQYAQYVNMFPNLRCTHFQFYIQLMTPTGSPFNVPHAMLSLIS